MEKQAIAHPRSEERLQEEKTAPSNDSDNSLNIELNIFECSMLRVGAVGNTHTVLIAIITTIFVVILKVSFA